MSVALPILFIKEEAMESSGSLNDDITNANLEQPLFPNKYKNASITSGIS